MASSDNLMTFDNHSWMFRNSCLDTWLPETFSKETETFSKAIHKSFDTQDFHNMKFSTEFMSPWLNDTTQVLTHTPTGSCGSPENEVNVRDDLPPLVGELKRPLIVNNGVMIGGSVKRSNGGCGGGDGGGKMKKRRTRASKRSTTTFINADAANFRQLVQEITGVKFGGGNGLFSVGGSGGGGSQLLKPQPHRVASSLQLIGGGGASGGGLVTLDTSAFLVDHTHHNNQDKVVFNHQVVCGGGGPSSAVVEGGGAVATSGFEFDSFCSFPTLESWKAI